jgi:hypothetical protein
MGRRDWLIFGSNGRDLEIFGNWIFGRVGSEKGRWRKHTGNRVTSWRNLVWGNLRVLRCFAKRFILGESEIGIFWVYERESTWIH